MLLEILKTENKFRGNSFCSPAVKASNSTVGQEGGRVQRFRVDLQCCLQCRLFETLSATEQVVLLKRSRLAMAAKRFTLDDLSFAPVLDLGHECRSDW